MEKLTLDTDALRDLLEHRKRGVEAMYEIWRLVDEGEVEWAVTRGVDFDIPEGPLRDRLKELPVLTITKTGKVARTGEWLLGVDVLGGEEFVSLEKQIRAEWAPGQRKLPGREDFDHVHTHWALGRDVFLTWDGAILNLVDKFSTLRIRVSSPEDYLKGRLG